MSFTPEQTTQLSAPLNASKIKTRKQGGKELSYVEGWHAIAEANRIFGFDGWNRETVLLQETNRDLVELSGSNGKYSQWRIGYIAKVRITAGGVIREGTGYGSGMGKPEALGDAVEGAIKEAETDAMKRALMTFGNPFGLALYDKEQNGVEHDDKPATAHTPPPATKRGPTLAQWVEAAPAEILALKTPEEMSAWLQKNNAAIEMLHDRDKALYNTINSKIAQRNDELRKVAA